MTDEAFDGRKYKLPYQVGGEKGLAIGIIQRAFLDAMANDERERVDALRFFISDWYYLLLEFLGLPRHYLPYVDNE